MIERHLDECVRCSVEVAQHHEVAGLLANSGGPPRPGCGRGSPPGWTARPRRRGSVWPRGSRRRPGRREHRPTPGRVALDGTEPATPADHGGPDRRRAPPEPDGGPGRCPGGGGRRRGGRRPRGPGRPPAPPGERPPVQSPAVRGRAVGPGRTPRPRRSTLTALSASGARSAGKVTLVLTRQGPDSSRPGICTRCRATRPTSSGRSSAIRPSRSASSDHNPGSSPSAWPAARASAPSPSPPNRPGEWSTAPASRWSPGSVTV